MNTTVTSKEIIMNVCRQIVSEKGLASLNMRMVAKECHIALGTLYNYYSDKNELLVATIESVWKDIFHPKTDCRETLPFPDYIAHIFDCVQAGAVQYSDFFTAHSVSITNAKKDEAKDIMERYFEHMKKRMTAALHSDAAVDFTVFSETFTESDFIDFVLHHMLLLLMEKKENCTILVELIRRVIYRRL